MKKIDVILLVVVLLALVVIGQRFFLGDSGSSAGSGADVQIPASGLTSAPVGNVKSQQGPFWILSKVKKLSDEDWKTATQSAVKFGRLVEVSDGCTGA